MFKKWFYVVNFFQIIYNELLDVYFVLEIYSFYM
jgi:hypothetical protein